MYPVYAIIRSLKKLPKRSDKTTLLNRHSDNEQLKRTFNLALNPEFNFGIKNIDNVYCCKGIVPLIDALDFLEFKLNTREVTGNQARHELRTLLENLSAVDQDIVLGILKRNLDCGVSVATVNQIWPNLIPSPDFMLATTDPAQLTFPAICQVKYDGMRVKVIWVNSEIYLITRNNSKVKCPDHLAKELTGLFTTSEFLDGELLCITEQQDVLDRQVGNGILNKLLKGTCSPEETLTIQLIAWDIVDPTKPTQYQERFNTLRSRLESKPLQFIHCAESKVVDSFDELTAYFTEQRERGLEGIVAKNLTSRWEPKRSKHWVKFKGIKTADLKVLGIIPGSGKYTGLLGALDVVSADGQVRVFVGTGFSDAQRLVLNNSRILGQIVEVAYDSRISNKSGIDSLFLPRFIRFRSTEKTVADSSKTIL